MNLDSYKNITYRDFPYNMVMTNSEGATAFLYDSQNNMSVMTPFSVDEEKIEKSETLEKVNELVDNLIHGDLYQNNEYSNKVSKNIEELGELELSDEEREYLRETIKTWAKKSKYVQTFTNDFAKIGFDISNVLYEKDSEYSDLIEACKKSEEKNLEDAKKPLEKTSDDVYLHETDTNELKQEGIDIASDEIPEIQTETEAPKDLDNIDPEMKRKLEQEMDITKSKDREDPDKVYEVVRTEKFDENISNDNLKGYYAGTGEFANLEQTVEPNKAVNEQSQDLSALQDLENDFNDVEDPSFEEQSNDDFLDETFEISQNEEPIIEQEPIGKEIPDEIHPVESNTLASTTNNFESVSSVINENGSRVIADSAYKIIKSPNENYSTIMYDCWKKLVYLDADRNSKNSEEFYKSIENTIDRAVDAEELTFIRDNLIAWVKTGGIASKNKEKVDEYIGKVQERMLENPQNTPDGYFRRDILDMLDRMNENSENPPSNDVDHATSYYSIIVDYLNNPPAGVSPQMVEQMRQVVNEQARSLVNNNNVLTNNKTAEDMQRLFNRKMDIIDKIKEKWANGPANKTDLKQFKLLLKQMMVMMENLPPEFDEYYKQMYQEYINENKEYVIEVTNKLKEEEQKQKEEYERMREEMMKNLTEQNLPSQSAHM